MNCNNDRELVKKHLLSSLKRLHLLNEGTIDMLESAVIEGGIIEIEMLWREFLKEDPPNKLKVLERDKKQLD